APSPVRPGHALGTLADYLAIRIAAESPPEGFGGLFRGADTPLMRVARPRMIRFTHWLTNPPCTLAQEPVAGLIGLGPGLTPSGDDARVGALPLPDALDEPTLHAQPGRAVVPTGARLPPPLSAHSLKAAASGRVAADLDRAVAATVAAAPDDAVAA